MTPSLLFTHLKVKATTKTHAFLLIFYKMCEIASALSSLDLESKNARYDLKEDNFLNFYWNLNQFIVLLKIIFQNDIFSLLFYTVSYYTYNAVSYYDFLY